MKCETERGAIITQNKMYFKYCFHIILLLYFYYLKYREVNQMLTKEDLQAIAGLLVPLETRIGNLEQSFGKLEGRFDNLEGRFDNFEGRFDNLEGRFDNLERRFDSFESETRNRFEDLEANLKSVDKHVCELDQKVAVLDEKVRGLQLHIENHTDVQLQIVAENHSTLFNKLEELEKKQNNQETLWLFVKKHENDINKIKQHLSM